MGYLTRKCSWGFLVNKNWLLFCQKRKCAAFKTILKSKTVTTHRCCTKELAGCVPWSSPGTQVQSCSKHPNFPTKQPSCTSWAMPFASTDSCLCSLPAETARLWIKAARLCQEHSQRMRTVNVPSASGRCHCTWNSSDSLNGMWRTEKAESWHHSLSLGYRLMLKSSSISVTALHSHPCYCIFQ